MSNKKEAEDKITFKVITIGDSEVGKTSIIRRYIFNIIYIYLFFKIIN